MADWGGKVAAWFAAVAGVSAALAALIATAAKPLLHGRLRDLFIALVVIAAVSFVTLLFTGPRALYGTWRNRHALKVPDLASRAEVLSGELFTFAAERDRDDPVREQPSRQAGVSDEHWQREWNEFSRRLVEHSAETKSRYDARFRVRALAIFNDAVQVGLEQEERRSIAENPTNTLGIRKVAEIIGMIAHSAQRSDGGRALPITPGCRRRNWWSQRTGAQQVAIICAAVGACGAIAAALVGLQNRPPTIHVSAGSSSSVGSGSSAPTPARSSSVASARASPGSSYIVAATIPVGSQPLWVAVSPDGKYAYVVNAGSSTVSVIDTTSNTVTATISVPGASRVAITPDSRYAYVTACPDCNTGQGNVSVIDTASNTVTATFTVGSGPFGVAISPDGRYAYVTDRNSDAVSVIDTARNTVTATIPVGIFPTCVAVSPNGRYAYVTNATTNTVSVINTATDTVTTTITAGSGAFGVAISPNGRYAYVANLNDGTVSVINTSSNTVTTALAVGSRPFAVAISPDGRYAYVTDADSNSVSVINTASNTLTATIPLVNPEGVAFAPDGRHAYITNHDANTVTVVDTGTG